MKKLNTVIGNNIQNGRALSEASVLFKSAFSVNTMPDRSFQKVALLTLILLGNVAWMAPSYGMDLKEMNELVNNVQHHAKHLNSTSEANYQHTPNHRKPKNWANYESDDRTARYAFMDVVNILIEKCKNAIGIKDSQLNVLSAANTNLQQDVTTAQNAQNQCHGNYRALTESFNAIVEESKDCKNSLQQQTEHVKEHKNIYYQAQSDLSWWKDSANLAGYSAAVGAVSSLLPEIIKDGVSLTRYSEYANKIGMAVTLLEGGLIAYNAAYYSPTLSGMFLPALTGMAVRSGLNYCGLAPEKAVTAGNTVAILTSFAQSCILEPETSLYEVLDHGIAVAGNWGGSIFALHTYDFLKSPFGRAQESNNPPNIDGDTDSPDDNPSTPTVHENFTNTPSDASDDDKTPSVMDKRKEINPTQTKENDEKNRSNELLENITAKNKERQEDLKRNVGKIVQITTTYEPMKISPVNPTLPQALASLQPLLLQLSDMNLESKSYPSIQKNMEEIMNLSVWLKASIQGGSRLENNLTPQLDQFTSELKNLHSNIEILSVLENEEASIYSLEYIDQLKYNINLLFNYFVEKI